MKRIAFLLSLIFMLFLVSCSSESSNLSEQSDTGSSIQEETESTTSESSSAGESSASSDKLVVFYSATNNTKTVAEYIANDTGANLFEIVPQQPYTEEDLNWNNSDSRVSREHDNPDQRDVPLESTEVPDWDSYSTVFLGYPIWWGGAAWPVDTFVKANNFDGKTVIPFCTSQSSGIGSSGEDLAKEAGTGTWQDGERFPSDATQEEVSAWLTEIGIK